MSKIPISRKVLIQLVVAIAAGAVFVIQDLQEQGLELGGWVGIVLPFLSLLAGRQVPDSNVAPSSVAAAIAEGKV